MFPKREGKGGMAKEWKGKFTHKGQHAVIFSSDLKDEPARGSKYCHNKKSQVFLVNLGQPVYKETKRFKFLMEVFSEYFLTS